MYKKKNFKSKSIGAIKEQNLPTEPIKHKNVIEIHSKAQFQELIHLHKVVVVEFFAAWCTPCFAFEEVLQNELAPNLIEQPVVFAKIDTDENEELGNEYKVETIPTFMIYVNGKVIRFDVDEKGQKKKTDRYVGIGYPDFYNTLQNQIIELCEK